MRNENIPIEKNREYTLEIEALGYEGEGIGKIDNFTVFVEGAIPGEMVNVRIVKVTKNYGYGKLLNIIKPSENRSIPVCGIYEKCGGCKLQHLNYESQLGFKFNRVKDCIEKIGKIKDCVIHPAIGMEQPYRYRNKVQLPVGKENDKVKIGFYAPRSHNIIDVEECHIQDEIGDKVIALTKEWMEKYKIEAYNEEQNTGVVRHIMVRKAFRTKEVMVVIVTNGNKLEFAQEYIKLITKNIPGIKSIIQNVNTEKTNVVLGKKCKTLFGSDVITDYIGDFKFNISPLSFFQVNPIQTEILYTKALEYASLTGNETVFDAYCGTGTISLFLSQKAKKVYGVEIIPEAVENAIENAKANGVENAEFIVGESEEVIPDLINKGIKAEVVVVDPPRKGCDKKLLDAIAKMEPQRIVYVSCDPATLARDLFILESLGYKTEEVQPVDMFPQTGHVETCVLLCR